MHVLNSIVCTSDLSEPYLPDFMLDVLFFWMKEHNVISLDLDLSEVSDDEQ